MDPSLLSRSVSGERIRTEQPNTRAGFPQKRESHKHTRLVPTSRSGEQRSVHSPKPLSTRTACPASLPGGQGVQMLTCTQQSPAIY
jgi:hypothetical protein